MVGTTAGAHGRLLERSQSGSRLAGVPDPRSVAAGDHELVREGGNARQVSEEVQSRAFGRQDRCQWARHVCDHLFGVDVVAVVRRPVDHHGGVDLRECFGRARLPRQHARCPDHEIRVAGDAVG